MKQYKFKVGDKVRLLFPNTLFTIGEVFGRQHLENINTYLIHKVGYTGELFDIENEYVESHLKLLMDCPEYLKTIV